MLNKILFFVLCCVLSACTMKSTEAEISDAHANSISHGDVLQSEKVFEPNGQPACVYLYEKLDNHENPDPVSCEYGNRSECCTWREEDDGAACEQQWCIAWDVCIWTFKQQSCKE